MEVRVESLLGVYTKYQHTYPNGDVAQTITVFFRCFNFPIDSMPPLFNQQHRDARADLIAGRSGVYR